jgi:hypothetical protein
MGSLPICFNACAADTTPQLVRWSLALFTLRAALNLRSEDALCLCIAQQPLKLKDIAWGCLGKRRQAEDPRGLFSDLIGHRLIWRTFSIVSWL